MSLNVHDYRDTITNGFAFCGVSEAFSVNGKRYQWPRKSKLTWSLAFDRLGNLSDADLKGANEDIFREIASVCQLDFAYTSNFKTANILVSLARLDGRSGTLADMQLPVGNVGPSTQLNGRVDIEEQWDIFDGPGGGRIDYRRTQKHEHLHVLGLGHKPESDKRKALIAPTYSDNLWMLQDADVEELQIRYGARETAIPQPTPRPTPVPLTGFTSALQVGVPSNGKVAIQLDLGFNGKKYKANGNAIEIAG